MPNKETEFVMDVRDPDSIAKLNEWCYENLSDSEYTATIITIFPLMYRFRFNCSKALVMAALNA